MLFATKTLIFLIFSLGVWMLAGFFAHPLLLVASALCWTALCGELLA
jgi:hypothetical protein